MPTDQTTARLKAEYRRILDDDRLQPRLRLLASVLLTWLTIKEEDKPFVKDIITTQFGTPKRITVKEPDDIPDTRIDREATEEIKKLFAESEEINANSDTGN